MIIIPCWSLPFCWGIPCSQCMVTFWLVLLGENREETSAAITQPQEAEPFLLFAAVRFGGKKCQPTGVLHKTLRDLPRDFTQNKIMGTEEVGKGEVSCK